MKVVEPTAGDASEPAYFVLQPVMKGGLLLAPLSRPGDDESWTMGLRFRVAPSLPVVAKIRQGYEGAEARPFMSVPPIMSEALVQILLDAGVSNLDVYDAVLQSADGGTRVGGFKAFNLIGLIDAADLTQTRFAADSSSRFLDASIESLAIDPALAKGNLMFRLAEHTSAIAVHRSIRSVLEVAGMASHVKFVPPSEFIS